MEAFAECYMKKVYDAESFMIEAGYLKDMKCRSFCCAAKGGFSKKVEELSKTQTVQLVLLGDMYGENRDRYVG